MRARWTRWALLVIAGAAWGKAPDAGAPLSAAECTGLIEAMMNVAVTESLASDPDVKRMSPSDRAATEKLARQQALTDPKLDDLKRACPKRYTAAQHACIVAAKSMAAIDGCSKPQ
ncbi:MAG: hypothetical protein JNG84_11165 [Archangium sp.]|nr:hypothetical protein [Archangium sp.]